LRILCFIKPIASYRNSGKEQDPNEYPYFSVHFSVPPFLDSVPEITEIIRQKKAKNPVERFLLLLPGELFTIYGN
jgi:hypothetical protein